MALIATMIAIWTPLQQNGLSCVVLFPNISAEQDEIRKLNNRNIFKYCIISKMTCKNHYY
jgi:hypothetical protein